MMINRCLAILSASLLVFCGCPSQTPNTSNGTSTNNTTDKLVMGEGGTVSDNLSISSGNVTVQQGQPGIVCGFVSKPDSSNDFTYVAIFSHNYPAAGFKTSSQGSGEEGLGSHTLQAFGNECKLEYRIEIDSTTSSVKNETMTIGGQQYNRSKGKLFLIDLKTSPPEVTQLPIEIPAVRPNLETTEAAESYGRGLLETLRKSDAAVESFCQKIESAGSE